MKTDFWTPYDVERALKMRADGLTNDQIANALGRSPKAVKVKLGALNITRKQRDRKNEYERRARVQRTQARIAGVRFEANKSRVPDDVLQERNARAMAYRSPAATLLGDPPEGFSQLDIKRREGGLWQQNNR